MFKYYKTEILVSIASIVITIVLLLPDIFGMTLINKNVLANFMPLAFSFFIIITSFIVKIIISQHKSEIQAVKNYKALKNLAINNHSILEDLHRCQKYNSELIEILNRLSKERDILGDTGKEAIGKFLEELEVIDDSVGFKSETLAISTYKVFWQKLVQLQADSKQKFIAKITHSNPIDIWANALDEAFLPQVDFIQGGGTVIRVLIDYDCDSSDREDYVKAFDKMTSKGIKTIYLPMYKKGLCPPYDFVMVDTGDWTYVVRWTSGNKGRNIVSSTISRYSDKAKLHEIDELKVIADRVRNARYDDSMPDRVKKKPEDILEILEH